MNNDTAAYGRAEEGGSMERLTYRDEDGRAHLTLCGKRMYCSAQATADCWIRVEDRLPEYDKEVLIHAVSKTTNESKIAISYLMDKFYFGSRPINLKEPIWHEPWQYFGANNTITHWMPLPEPPKEG